MNDYLNAKSMVTPGVAGGLITLISNTFATQFNFPPKWTALILSALLGLLVVCILTAPLWEKGILWLFNALIIFSMAIGTNQAGVSLQPQSEVLTTFNQAPYPLPTVAPSASPFTETPTLGLSPAAASTGAGSSPSLILPPAAQEQHARVESTKFFRPWIGPNA